MFNYKKQFLTIFSIIFILMMSGCVEGDPVDDSGDDEGGEASSDLNDSETFVVAQSSNPEIMDPGNATDESDMDVISQMFEGLVKFKNDDLDIEPALATDWENSDDG